MYVTSKFIVFAKAVLAVVFNGVGGQFWKKVAVLDVKVVWVLVLVGREVECFSTEVVWEQRWDLVELSV